MLQIKTKVGQRGQIVIPKKIRESIGLQEKSTVVLSVDEKGVHILVSEKDIASSWAEFAKKEGGNVSKSFVYGDKLYEEVF